METLLEFIRYRFVRALHLRNVGRRAYVGMNVPKVNSDTRNFPVMLQLEGVAATVRSIIGGIGFFNKEDSTRKGGL